MKSSRIEVYVHVVWGTWDRAPLIEASFEGRLWAVIATAFAEMGCLGVVVGGVADHVHVVMGLPATVSLADVVQRAKGTSSHFANHEAGLDGAFRWQGGYAAFSVSARDLPLVAAYVRGQKSHHDQALVDPSQEL